jgi:hypothetical protein
MKTKVCVVTMFYSILGTIIPAFAAEGVREDSSSYLVWAFLGMCALIIVLQLLPVILLLFGTVKGISKDKQSTVDALSDK